jgi:hypothetical protein
MDKPHKGTIRGYRKDINWDQFPDDPLDYPKNLGYIIVGRFLDHPRFGSSTGYTSLVTKKGRWKNNKCEIETLNSKYTWERSVGV